MSVILYAHGGSGNHGCEAIVRSTVAMLQGQDIYIASIKPEEDKKYGIDEIANIYSEKKSPRKFSIDFMKAYWQLKVQHNYWKMDQLFYKEALPHLNTCEAAISIGGDNYCYADVQSYILMHDIYREQNIKTVLWGCSVEPDLLNQENIRRDLEKYSLITARETITYEALKKVNNNTILVSDPAFSLKSVEKKLPKEFIEGNTVGINISPMIMENENVQGMAYENYRCLIRYILAETDMHIALIPHVVWNGGDDRIPLKKLYNEFGDQGRVALIEDCNCMELKGYIKRCRFFIGARTHATIAAYSTGVPTLVVGYSVKARGIAKDIFGTDNHYVIPVQSLRNTEQLLQAFVWIYENENNIKGCLQEIMPSYCKNVYTAYEAFKSLV